MSLRAVGLQCEQRELTIVITLRHDLLYFVGVSYRFSPLGFWRLYEV